MHASPSEIIFHILIHSLGTATGLGERNFRMQTYAPLHIYRVLIILAMCHGMSMTCLSHGMHGSNHAPHFGHFLQTVFQQSYLFLTTRIWISRSSFVVKDNATRSLFFALTHFFYRSIEPKGPFTDPQGTRKESEPKVKSINLSAKGSNGIRCSL